MFKRNREVPELERLNLVPIMDAVFIFIFFLLFSAQFIKIFEIETSAPVVSEVPTDVKVENDPLNLIVKVYDRKIEVMTGVDQNIEETYFMADDDYIEKLKEKLVKLRISHPKDDYAIISPIASIKYDEIIKIIDAVQSIPKGKVVKINNKGESKELSKIFTQIVLEPLSED